jgi:hypothetical protein
MERSACGTFTAFCCRAMRETSCRLVAGYVDHLALTRRAANRKSLGSSPKKAGCPFTKAWAFTSRFAKTLTSERWPPF